MHLVFKGLVGIYKQCFPSTKLDSSKNLKILKIETFGLSSFIKLNLSEYFNHFYGILLIILVRV